MPFKPLTPNSRANTGVDLGFAIRSPGGPRKTNYTLEIVMSAETMRKAKLSPEEWLRLDVDDSARMLRLTKVANGTSKASRRLRVSTAGRGMWSIPCSGPLKDWFGNGTSLMQALEIEETNSEGITFKAPSLEPSPSAS